MINHWERAAVSAVYPNLQLGTALLVGIGSIVAFAELYRITATDVAIAVAVAVDEQVATNEMMNHLGTAILIIVAYGLYRNYEDYYTARALLKERGFDPDDPVTPMIWYCYTGDLTMIRSSIARGADCRKVNAKGYFPLFVAAAYGHLEIVQFLSHECGAHEDIESGLSSLGVALLNGYFEVVQWLIRNGALAPHDDVDGGGIDDAIMRNGLCQSLDPLRDVSWTYDKRLTVLLLWAQDAVTIPQLKATNDELDFSSNAPMMIDSGAECSTVPLDYHLENERSTPYVIHAYCSAATDHFLVAQVAGELPLNLPKQARTAHKMNFDVPILSVREPVKQGCIVVFGYGENKDAIICDKDDIEIIVTGSPLVTGKLDRGGLWCVSDYDPLPGQQQRSPPASSSSSMLSSNAPIVIDSGTQVNLVPLGFRLNNERPTPNGIHVRSFTNHSMVAQETGELPLINLPKRARTAHKVDVNTPLMSVSEPVKQGCVVVFGYGENKDAIICDENDIEIILKKPPLVTGKLRSRDGKWYVGSKSYLEWLTAAYPTPGQQMRQLIDRLSACIAEVPFVEEEGGEDE